MEQIHRLTREPDERVLFRDVDWGFYENLVDTLPEGTNIRVVYDGKDVEIMAPSLLHDDAKGLLGQLVEAVAQESGSAYKRAGQTTWRRTEANRGLEADECYYFDAMKLEAVAAAKARQSWDIGDYPNPDLAIEVDFSTSQIDRPAIYEALKIAEVWRFDGQTRTLVIERPVEDGHHAPVARSGFLPIRADQISRWIVDEDTRDESSWARRLRAWLRAELDAGRPGG